MVKALLFHELEHFFEEFARKSPEGIRICAAVSGGCDSVALFHALLAQQDKLGIARLGIAHVNHKLRGAESDADAAFVKHISLTCRVPFHEKLLNPRPGTSGMEEWARRERYDFFNDLRSAEGYDYIATGHTADDQAETVLMRMMRGCGLRGLCAIAPVREDGVIRPILNVKRASLVTWLKESGLAHREDSSNSDIFFKRNLVRLKLLPALMASPRFDAALLPRIAQAAQAAWKPLSKVLNNWTDCYVVSHDADHFEMKKSGFIDVPFADEACAEVLRTKGIQFEHYHIVELVSNARRRDGIFLLPGGWRYRCGREIIEFELKQGTLSTEARGDQGPQPVRYELIIGATTACESVDVNIEIQPVCLKAGERVCFFDDNMTVYLDADYIKGPIEFRNVRAGDVFQPLGCEGHRNLKGYLKKRKIDYRVQGIVAEKNGGVLWVPGVQIRDQCKVTSQTTAVLKFSCKPR